jgi:hypothetical protein
LYSNATATNGCTKSELTGANERFGIFRANDEHKAWWFKIKIMPKAKSCSIDDALSSLDECPVEYSLSKLLGIRMNKI